MLHSNNIAGKSFRNEHVDLLKELGGFVNDIGKVEPDYIRSFQFEAKLLPSTWIVIRIDGCHLYRFSEAHEFVKPNDERALNFMNSCAVAVLKEFRDIVFAYGVSDEYSFVVKRDSQFYQRWASDIVTTVVSFFTSMYMIKWKDFFPQKELKYQPSFDGRAVCQLSSEILRDYLTWRQVTSMNKYNTCFWELVKSGKSKCEAQNVLKGTQAAEKNELLKQFGISDCHTLPVMFRQGSSVFWDKEDDAMEHEEELCNETYSKKVVLRHCNIIEASFRKSHPSILSEKVGFSKLCL